MLRKSAGGRRSTMPLVLAYNFSPARLAAVRVLCARLKIRLRAVEKNEFGCTVGSLCGQSAPQGEDTQEDDFSDEMIVMAGFSGQMLNAFLHSFYTYHLAPVSLKAVLTEVNAQFTGLRLHQELCAEREAIRQGMQANARRGDG